MGAVLQINPLIFVLCFAVGSGQSNCEALVFSGGDGGIISQPTARSAFIFSVRLIECKGCSPYRPMNFHVDLLVGISCG